MSPNQRTAFWLRTVDGRSIEEIAEIMGSAKSTARMRVYYGRKAFKKGLRRQLSADTQWRSGHLPDSPGGE
jgi:DNA-directed RNA polymerase specialized sigma24 family protein